MFKLKKKPPKHKIKIKQLLFEGSKDFGKSFNK